MQRLVSELVIGGRYHLVSRVATGGMGDVWEARDDVLDRRVAIKVLRPDLAEAETHRLRFRAEARHAAALAHPNIATVFDYGEHEDLAYIVMELVDGPTLGGILARDGLCHRVGSVPSLGRPRSVSWPPMPAVLSIAISNPPTS